uniref:Uncharacterized protein n=1 Tax=Anguilla anguilla TaxID=7936 RepID=A0A0E9QTF5_ANGAN
MISLSHHIVTLQIIARLLP